MRINLIVAMDQNGLIGNRGKLPWHCPDDLKWFKHVTQGNPVIMGRKTWESLPESVRPLPSRMNIVAYDTDMSLIKPDK